MKNVMPLCLTFLLLATCTWAQLPSESIGVSGVLKGPSGAPVVGPVDIDFRIYDSMVVGLLLWSELHTGVPLDDAGRYHATLGGMTPRAPGLFASGDAWLTVEVNADGEMAPRLALSRVPAAFNSDLLNGLPPSTFAPRVDLYDQDPATSPVHWLDLAGVPPGFADGVDDVDDADADPMNELNAAAALLGTSLQITDAGGSIAADLSSLVDDADADPTNELVTSVILNGVDLEVTDAGGTHVVNLASLLVGTPTGPAAGDVTGTYPAPTLAPDSVGSAEILDGTVGVADLDLASVDARYVNVTGDTVTGDLVLEGDLTIDATSGVGDAIMRFGHPLGSREMRLFHDEHFFEVPGRLATAGNFRCGSPRLAPYSSIGFGGYARYPEIASGDDLYVVGDVELGRSLALGGFGTVSQVRWLSGEFFGWVDAMDTFVLTDSFHVRGSLSKLGGTFKIDHPLDPANKYLYHSFVESPDMMNVYNGNVILDDHGEAWVELPGYFEALNSDYRYQLSAVGVPAPDLHVAHEVANSRFMVAGGSPGAEVSWQVTGVRQDPYARDHRVQVESEKIGRERGMYLYPEGYGQPAEKGIGYAAGRAALDRD